VFVDTLHILEHFSSRCLRGHCSIRGATAVPRVGAFHVFALWQSRLVFSVALCTCRAGLGQEHAALCLYVMFSRGETCSELMTLRELARL